MVRARSAQPEAAWRGTVVGSGPRLVLVHGGPGLEHRVLLPLAEQLAPFFEVWLPDLPGHGADPDRPDPTLAHVQKSVVRAVADHGGAELVVGHSLGAWLVREGLRTGAVAPHRGAVLLAPPSGGRPRIRTKRLPKESPRSVADALRAQVRTETGRTPSERWDHCLENAVLHSVDATPRLFRAVDSALGKPLPRFRPAVDVLILTGVGDAVVSPHQASEIADATGRATLLTLPGVGHYPAATGDDGVAEAILDFADRLLARPARRRR